MKLKPALLWIFTVCIVSMSYGQHELKISTSDNAQLIKVLNNAEQMAENSMPNLSIRVYKVDNRTASAGFPTSEVTHMLFIAVSEFDEEPNQNLFEIGPFYNPSFIKWSGDNNNQKEFEIAYGAHNNRKLVKLKVNVNELTME